MPRALTNKQILVLEVLRGLGDATVHEVASEVAERTPCSNCDQTGQVAADRCRECHGRGHAYFGYGDAYVVLKALRKTGLVERRCRRDEWGDELATHVYSAVVVADPDDPLEKLWAAPALTGTEESP